MLGTAAVIALWVCGQVPPPAPEAPEPPVAQLTKPPRLLTFVEAPYPEAAEAVRLEGEVLLIIDVDAEGLVARVEVAQTSSTAFSEPAAHAATQFVFSPAEAGELGPVPVRITYRYRFVLAPLVTTSTQTATKSDDGLVVRPINFRGTVLESGSRKPLAYAEIEVQLGQTATITGVQTSTETDERGRFALRGLPPGPHVIKVKAPFFSKFQQREIINPNEALEVLYFVERSARNPYEVVVRAKAPRKEVARHTLQLDQIRRIPGAQGDAIRVVQNMPGVARTPFGLGLLVVRGAPPQDTGVFIDGQRVPILFHFGGLGGVTSVVHSAILEQVNFLPGGFGPQYGLASAGVVELVTRSPKTDRVHGEAQLDTVAFVPVNVSVFVEGPVTDDPADGAFVFSLRRSSIDGVLALITSLADTAISLVPRYYDYSAKYEVPIGGDSRRTLTLFSYGSDDELVLLGAAGLGASAATADSTQSRTFFHRFNPSFTYRPDEDTELVIAPTIGVDSTDTNVPSSGGGGSAFTFRALNYSAGLLVKSKTRLADWASLRLGGDLLYYVFNSETELPAFASVRDFPSPVPDDAPTRSDDVVVPAIATSLFGELELNLFERLTLWPGFRLQVLDFFAEDQPLIDPRLVEGRTIVGFDPRMTARYQLHEDWSLKGQAGLYSQPALPPAQFLNADLPFQNVQQYSGGFEWQIIDKLSLDLQGFYRYGTNIADATSRREVVDGTVRPIGFLPNAKRRAFGMEMLLRLDNRWGLFGWIAYTLSRSEISRDEEPFRPNFVFDQTHNLNVVAVYELGLNWFVGSRFRFVSGGGLPNTINRWFDADLDAYDREFGGLRRAPPFHQLDLYLEKRWILDEWYIQASLDIQNIYNRTNTEFFAPTFDFKTEVPIPGLPILPTFNLKGVF